MSNDKWKMYCSCNRRLLTRFTPPEPLLHALEIQINHRGQIQRDDLRYAQAADDCQPQSASRLSAGAPTQSNRQRAHKRRHRRHHDRTKPDQTRLKDRFLGRLAFFALRRQGEVEEGKPAEEAIFQACLIRFRPIMMTTM